MTHILDRIQILYVPKVSKLLFMVSIALFAGAGLWAIGFSNTPAVHNALHDLRHSIGFPCH